jgi:pimeloyl-ACP methyl ester carboxylesterase
MNLPALRAFQPEMSAYAPPANARYAGETLFIGGETPAYRIDHDRDLIVRHFPKNHLVMIPSAGHWLHFEALEAFTASVTHFMENDLDTFL